MPNFLAAIVHVLFITETFRRRASVPMLSRVDRSPLMQSRSPDIPSHDSLEQQYKQTLICGPFSDPYTHILSSFSLDIQSLDVSKEAARLFQLGVAVAKVPADDDAGLTAANDPVGVVL